MKPGYAAHQEVQSAVAQMSMRCCVSQYILSACGKSEILSRSARAYPGRLGGTRNLLRQIHAMHAASRQDFRYSQERGLRDCQCRSRCYQETLRRTIISS